MWSSVKILKFGGTSLGNGERIRHVAHIIARNSSDSEHVPVVVVSAMAGITDQLLRIAHYSHIGQQKECEYELSKVKQKHLEAAKKAVQNRELLHMLLEDIEAAFSVLERDVRVVASSALSDVPLLSAAVAAWGERLSVLLVAAATCQVGVEATAVREEVIITAQPQSETTQPSGVTEPSLLIDRADPLPEKTRSNAQALIHPLLERRIVPIVAGFIGRTTTGLVTTLGRNGSDYSAAVIGAALDCVEVFIYTDVDGVLSADPRLVANARLLRRLSYAEAAHLSWFGAKVLHPRTLIPLASRNIPVYVRNTFRPHEQGTVIGADAMQRSGAAAITIRRKLALITVESTDIFGTSEHAGQVFALAARAGVAPVAICSSSGHHLSFLVEERAADSIVALLQEDMGAWRVLSRSGLAACACIGSGFTADPMSSARAIIALARERIPVITQGASQPGIILVVEDRDSEAALRCLHRDLIAPVIPLVRHAPEGKFTQELLGGIK